MLYQRVLLLHVISFTSYDFLTTYSFQFIKETPQNIDGKVYPPTLFGGGGEGEFKKNKISITLPINKPSK